MGVLIAATWMVATRLAMPWESVIYRDKKDLTAFVRLGQFASLDACRNASLSALDALGSIQTGTYECGQYCRAMGGLTQPQKWYEGIAYTPDDDTHICQTTAR
jgi:hypothetical protein